GRAGWAIFSRARAQPRSRAAAKDRGLPQPPRRGRDHQRSARPAVHAEPRRLLRRDQSAVAGPWPAPGVLGNRQSRGALLADRSDREAARANRRGRGDGQDGGRPRDLSSPVGDRGLARLAARGPRRTPALRPSDRAVWFDGAALARAARPIPTSGARLRLVPHGPRAPPAAARRAWRARWRAPLA